MENWRMTTSPCKSLNLEHEVESDDELIKRYFSNGDEQALLILYQRYYAMVFRASRNYLRCEERAKDAAGEVFLKLWTHLKKARPTSFKVWLYVVVKNYCFEVLRQKWNKFEVKRDDQLLADLPEPHHEEEGEEGGHRKKLLKLSLEQLATPQRTCLEMFFYQGLRYQEISEMTEWNIKQVKSHIQNGKRNLKLKMRA